MKITESEVRNVADLANLDLTESEIVRLAKDMDEILTHMDALNELDTSTVEPMTQVLYQSEESATLRADQVTPPIGNEAALTNAPVSGAGYYKVPKVIER